MTMKDKIIDVMIGFSVSTLSALSVFGLAYACFAPRSAFSAPAAVATADTQWGDVVPTNSIGSVMASAGMATVEYVDRVVSEALVSITDDFAKNFTPLAAPIITNVVEDILTPRTVDWYFDSTNQTSAAVMPNWTTSRVNIEVDQSWVEAGTSNILGQLYASGKLRNYSLVMDSIPGNTDFTVFVVDPDIATNSSYKIYATPAMKDLSDIAGEQYFGWQIMSNDVPCAITVRQPDNTTILFRRDRLNSDDAHIRIEDGEPVLYTE